MSCPRALPAPSASTDSLNDPTEPRDLNDLPTPRDPRRNSYIAPVTVRSGEFPVAARLEPARFPRPKTPETKPQRNPLAVVKSRLSRLHECKNPWEAAARCLGLAFGVQKFRSALVCVVDVDFDQVVVIASIGPDGKSQVLSRAPRESDPFFTARNVHRPFVHRQASAPAAARHARMPLPGELLIAPILTWGRCVATLELSAPEGVAFGHGIQLVLQMAADRFADHLTTLGVVRGFSIDLGPQGAILTAR